jgi:hypothetical protein
MIKIKGEYRTEACVCIARLYLPYPWPVRIFEGRLVKLLIYRETAEERHAHLSVPRAVEYVYMQEPASAVFFIHESG